MTLKEKIDFIRSAMWHQDDCGSGWGKPCNCRHDRAQAYLDEIETKLASE